MIKVSRLHTISLEFMWNHLLSRTINGALSLGRNEWPNLKAKYTHYISCNSPEGHMICIEENVTIYEHFKWELWWSRIIQFKSIVADFLRMQKYEDSGYHVLDKQNRLFLTGVMFCTLHARLFLQQWIMKTFSIRHGINSCFSWNNSLIHRPMHLEYINWFENLQTIIIVMNILNYKSSLAAIVASF